MRHLVEGAVVVPETENQFGQYPENMHFVFNEVLNSGRETDKTYSIGDD